MSAYDIDVAVVNDLVDAADIGISDSTVHSSNADFNQDKLPDIIHIVFYLVILAHLFFFHCYLIGELQLKKVNTQTIHVGYL